MRLVSAARPLATNAPSFAQMPARWRAAGAILTGAFPTADDVWACVSPGIRADLSSLYNDSTRPMQDRVLLACAQAFIDQATVLPFGELVNLTDARLRLVLDALAIARGSLPID